MVGPICHHAVVSTLAAFGGSPAAVDNLRRLHAAGATVLYGTDLGNTRDAGPSAEEPTPARYWNPAPSIYADSACARTPS